jgi:hypothetical protein
MRNGEQSGTGATVRPKGLRARLRQDEPATASASNPAPLDAPVTLDAEPSAPTPPQSLATPAPPPSMPAEVVAALTAAVQLAETRAHELTALSRVQPPSPDTRSLAHLLEWMEHEKRDMLTRVQAATEELQRATAAVAQASSEANALLTDRTRELTAEVYRNGELVRRVRLVRWTWLLASLGLGVLGGIVGGLVAR